MRSLHICLFIGELDDMEPCATDIGNAYLEALTKEKFFIRAGQEFGDLKGHMFIIYKSVYELQLSGKAFGQMLQEYLLDLSFVPLLVELSIYRQK